jgi:hypothetical protein
MAAEIGTNGNNKQARLNWAALLGQWEITDALVRFDGDGRVGLAVSSAAMQNGTCRVRVRFGAPFAGHEQAGGIVFGYRSLEQNYFFVELGGHSSAYSIGEFVGGFGWRPLVAAGELQNLKQDRDYSLQVNLSGQELEVSVDDVPVLQHLLSHPLEGRQVGLIAAGTQPVTFSEFDVSSGLPRAFVVMQFAEPFNTFYREVIQKQAEAAGFEVFRIDEKAGPGIIFQDIQREIERAEIVVAEVTPANPNVFYELGYAHALGKPTILLAQRGAQLPFDIRSFRVVFHNDSIGGKSEVERDLKKHLEAIAGR